MDDALRRTEGNLQAAIEQQDFMRCMQLKQHIEVVLPNILVIATYRISSN